MRKFLAVLGMALVGAAVFASQALATVTSPDVDVEPLAQGIIDALTANLPTILAAAGVLAGVFFVLRMAKRWFGARASA